MFGGVINDFTENPVYNNRLFRIDPTGNNVLFTQIVTHGDSPTERAFPSMAVTRKGNQENVYVFGGGTFPFNIPLANDDKFWREQLATLKRNDAKTSAPIERRILAIGEF